jgi:Fe-S cluster assembly iron-binding protein IscA
MLVLTPTAAEVVTAIVSSQSQSENAGMRITSEEGAASADGGAPNRDVRLSLVEEPDASDEQVEGAPVYVEPGSTSELLGDKVLDAEVSGEEVHFRIMPQPD